MKVIKKMFVLIVSLLVVGCIFSSAKPTRSGSSNNNTDYSKSDIKGIPKINEWVASVRGKQVLQTYGDPKNPKVYRAYIFADNGDITITEYFPNYQPDAPYFGDVTFVETQKFHSSKSATEAYYYCEESLEYLGRDHSVIEYKAYRIEGDAFFSHNPTEEYKTKKKTWFKENSEVVANSRNIKADADLTSFPSVTISDIDWNGTPSGVYTSYIPKIKSSEQILVSRCFTEIGEIVDR